MTHAIADGRRMMEQITAAVASAIGNVPDQETRERLAIGWAEIAITIVDASGAQNNSEQTLEEVRREFTQAVIDGVEAQAVVIAKVRMAMNARNN